MKLMLNRFKEWFSRFVLTTVYGGIVLMLTAIPAFGQSGDMPKLDPGTKDKITAIMENAYDKGWFQGSVGVFQTETSFEPGTTLYANSIGTADFTFSIANTSDTIFSIGSITKQFTAALVLKLVQEGHLKLTDRLSQYLPYYKQSCPQFKDITVQEALDMSTNIRNYATYWDFNVFSRLQVTPAQFLTTYACVTGPNELGTFEYSDTNYFLLGALIEAVLEPLNQQTYPEYLQEEIVGYLGLEDTGYLNQRTIIPNYAGAYLGTTNTPFLASYVSYSVAYSAGAMYSNIFDLNTWWDALVNNRILDPEYTDMMLTGHIATTGSFTEFYPGSSYGFGVVIQPSQTPDGDPLTLVGHSGVINGYLSQVWGVYQGGESTPDPKWDYFVVVLSNLANGCYAPVWMANNIVDVLYGGDALGPEGFFQQLCHSSGDAKEKKIRLFEKKLWDILESDSPY